MKELIELRNKLKKIKPKFVRQDAHKKVRVGSKWRRPKGIDSKMRLKLKGYRRSPDSGWGSPKKVIGLTKDGLEPIIVSNVKELDKIKENQGVVISGKSGKKKKVEIIKAAKEKGIKIINVKDADAYIQSVEDNMAARRSKKKNRQEKKEKAEKEKKEAANKKEEKPEKKEAGEEDKKDVEKKEKDKLLTKKEM